ncbi:MAG: hypothetical protein CSB44_01630 [Gammaproteobacteria bacterium]|nr:MAG: hypothetical protein CSB44_01630 [Gammaproteobacteria bacterium]
MSASDALIRAGALLPTDTEADERFSERVEARCYRGDGLGEREVVLLGAERLAETEQIAMAAMGLDQASTSGVLAVRGRRTLDFLYRALSTHPESADEILALSKRLAIGAEKIAANPRRAWQYHRKIATELTGEQPQLLAAFWEAVARNCKDRDDLRYAPRALELSLAAEENPSSGVDFNHRHDVMVEFALAGCLSARALGRYTSSLAKFGDPGRALRQYRDVIQRRTLSGLPPSSSQFKDIRRLARAAGKDPEAEIDAALLAMLPAPSMQQVREPFWEAASEALTRLAADDDSVAAWLLVHTPTGRRARESDRTVRWLARLDGWDALRLLSQPAADWPEEVHLPGGRAGWFAEVMQSVTIAPARLFDLFEEAAGALKADGIALPLCSNDQQRMATDVDLIETCLSLGIPLAATAADAGIEFRGWCATLSDHPRRHSTLDRVFDDESLAAQIRKQIPALLMIGQNATSRRSFRKPPGGEILRPFTEVAARNRHVVRLWQQHVDALIERATHGGVIDAQIAFSTLQDLDLDTTSRLFPYLRERLESVSPATILRRSLNAGVLEEYEEGEPIASPAVLVKSPFPSRIVFRNQRLIELTSSGERELGVWDRRRLDPEVVIILPNDTLVLFRTRPHLFTRAIWLSDPDREFDLDVSVFDWPERYLQPVADGLFCGGGILRPGDTCLPEFEPFFSDGERHWRRDAIMAQGRSCNADGSSVAPPWFEESLPDKAEILWKYCQYLPAPENLSASPLGIADGIIGWRVARLADGSFEGRGADGRKCVVKTGDMAADRHGIPLAMIDRPSGEGHWVQVSAGHFIDAATGIAFDAPPGRLFDDRFIAATWPLSPMDEHRLRVRCLPASATLRRLDEPAAGRLLAAGQAFCSKASRNVEILLEGESGRALRDTIGKLLPAADDTLIRGVARVVHRLCLADSIRSEIIERLPVPGNVFVPEAVQLESLRFNWSSRIRVNDARRSYCHAAVRHLQQLIGFFRGGKAPDASVARTDWLGLLDDPAAFAWPWFWQTINQLPWEASGAEIRAHFEQQPEFGALACLVDSGLLDLRGEFALFTSKDLRFAPSLLLPWKQDRRVPAGLRQSTAFVEDGVRHVVYRHPEQLLVISHAESGNVRPPNGFPPLHKTTLRQRWSSQQLLDFLDALRQIEQVPRIDPGLLEKAASELGVPAAVLGIIWMGNFRPLSGQPKGEQTADMRAHHGWSQGEWNAAVACIDALGYPQSLSAAALRAFPAKALQANPVEAFGQLVDVWRKDHRQMSLLPLEVVLALRHIHVGYRRLPVRRLVEMLHQPSALDELSPRTANFEAHLVPVSPGSTGGPRVLLERVYDPPLQREVPVARESSFNWLDMLFDAICLINHGAPAGHPCRQALPRVITAVREWLDDAELELPFGGVSTACGGKDEVTIDIDGTVARFLALTAGEVHDREMFTEIRNDRIRMALAPPVCSLLFRPANIRTTKDIGYLTAIASQTRSNTTVADSGMQMVDVVARFRSHAADRFMEVNQADGSNHEAEIWDQCPEHSVADLVTSVAEQLELGRDAACLYLQILALPDPTGVRIRRWNGWKPARFRRAAKALEATDLVVSGKRSRASRNLFLPGAWESLTAPNLPIEQWKLHWYDELSRNPHHHRQQQGQDELHHIGPSDRFPGKEPALLVPPLPAADLFLLAWERVQFGNRPG